MTEPNPADNMPLHITGRLERLEGSVEGLNRSVEEIKDTITDNRKRTAHSIRVLRESMEAKVDENTREMAAVEHELKAEIANTNSRIDKTNEILYDIKSVIQKHALILYLSGALVTILAGAWFKSMFDAALKDRDRIEHRIERVEQGHR